jgi:hypothetical protein
MASVTPPPWPARRVGDSFLCCRKVAARFVCQGVIAYAYDELPMYVIMPSGLTEDPARL